MHGDLHLEPTDCAIFHGIQVRAIHLTASFRTIRRKLYTIVATTIVYTAFHFKQ